MNRVRHTRRNVQSNWVTLRLPSIIEIKYIFQLKHEMYWTLDPVRCLRPYPIFFRYCTYGSPRGESSPCTRSGWRTLVSKVTPKGWVSSSDSFDDGWCPFLYGNTFDGPLVLHLVRRMCTGRHYRRYSDFTVESDLMSWFLSHLRLHFNDPSLLTRDFFPLIYI